MLHLRKKTIISKILSACVVHLHNVSWILGEKCQYGIILLWEYVGFTWLNKINV